MKFNFRKISTIAASAIMVCSTMGMAAAAAYPAPFVVGSTADVAVVYGTGAGVSSLDLVQSASIQGNLQSYMTGTGGGSSVGVTGESVSLDSDSSRIWLNTSLNTAQSTFGSTDLPTVLGTNTFSGNVDAKMTSTIKIISGATAGGANSGKVIFAKQPKSSDDPSVGISLGASTQILYNASVTMKATNFTHADSEGEEITLFGRNFVISSSTDTTSLVLFASAEKINLCAGADCTDPSSATVTIEDVEYTIELVTGTSTTAKIAVTKDGVTESNEITESSTSKKINGLEVAVKDVTESTAINRIDASILVGADKITLTPGSTVTMGADDDPVDGTIAYISGGPNATTEIAVAVYRPTSSTDAIIAGESFVDPVFGSFKVDFVGLSTPFDDITREEVIIANSGDKGMMITFTDSDGNTGSADIAYNATYAQPQANTPVRKNANWRLADDGNYSIFVHEGANLTEDDYVILGNEDYGHLLKVIQIYNNTGTTYTNDKVKLEDVISGEIYDTVFTSESIGTISVDGKTYAVKFLGDGDGGYTTIKYPTSDSATTSTFVMYPTIQTVNGMNLALYEPLNITMGAINGTVATSTTILSFPDGDGYTTATFTYQGLGNWTIAGAATARIALNESLGTNVTNLTIGKLKYNISSGGAALYGNFTQIYLINPEDATNIAEPSVVLFEEKDDNNEYHAVIVNLETAPAGTSSDGCGVDAVLMTQYGKYGFYEETLASDSDVTQNVDWWGTLATTDADDSDQKTATISYPKSQVYAQIYIGEVGSDVTATTTAIGGTQLGDVLVKDTEVSSVSSKNLIVIGGSCINSAAASLVGGAHCSVDWTTATNVGSGEFLIKSYASSSITTKMALLVAGYDAADTVNAATYLKTKTVDTSKGYIGTTATAAATEITEA
ncbi:MAG: hypothetical protein V1697_02845 [Candidatus Levyibacteriota bacterium]